MLGWLFGSHTNATAVANAPPNLEVGRLTFYRGPDGARGAASGWPGVVEDAANTWTSEAGQDRVVAALLGGKRGGYFVDLAANLPFKQSNTRALERDLGWRGICIDGNDDVLLLLARYRACSVVGAIVSSRAGERVHFRRWSAPSKVPIHMLSGIVGLGEHNKRVNASAAEQRRFGLRDDAATTVTLEHILRAHAAPARVDYLSLDVEGAEEKVLAGFDFDNYSFSVMTIERPSHRLAKVLMSRDYAHMCDNGQFGDQLWVHAGLVRDARRKLRRTVPASRGISREAVQCELLGT
jgi:FkbM family methyltransferase